MGHCKKNIPCFFTYQFGMNVHFAEERAFQELQGPDGSSNVNRLEFSVEPENIRVRMVSLRGLVQLLHFVIEIEALV